MFARDYGEYAGALAACNRLVSAITSGEIVPPQVAALEMQHAPEFRHARGLFVNGPFVDPDPVLRQPAAGGAARGTFGVGVKDGDLFGHGRKRSLSTMKVSSDATNASSPDTSAQTGVRTSTSPQSL